MPSFAKAHGTVITVLALLQTLSASTKLSVVSQTGAIATNATTRASIIKLSPTMTTANITTTTSAAVNTTNHTLANKIYARRRSKLYGDPSRQQTQSIPEYAYSWQPQAYNMWPDYNYHDQHHQAASMPDLTTIAYPYLTTPQPIRTNDRPKVTKLYVKPFRRTINFLDLDEDGDEHIPYSSSFYSGGGGGGLYRWPPTIPSLPTVQLTPVTTYHHHARPPTGGYSHSDERMSSIEHYHGAIGHHSPVIYHHHHEDSSSSHSKMDLKHIGIIALVKLGLTKLKMFGILKLLFLILFKFKLLLLIMFIKFLMFLKAIKHLKALLLPFLLLLALLALPLLLLPLLLPLLALRYLLPLLLLLPLPGPARIRVNKADNRLIEYLKTQRSDPIMDILAQLMDAEQCVERIACQLATKKESRLLFPIVKWYMNKMKKILKHGRIISFVEAYVNSSQAYEDSEDPESIDSQQWCQKQYLCATTTWTDEQDRENDSSNSTSTSTTNATKYIMINRVTKKK